MTQKHKKSLSLPIYTILTFVMVSLLASACALGGSSSNTTSATSTPSARSSNSHPVAGQPVATGKLPPGQPLPGNEVKQLVFDLLYNDAAMERDVAAIYTPASPVYHRFLTPGQIMQRYGPSSAQQQTVENWLKQNGYTIITVDPMHTSIKVQATVATIERSLNIKLQAFSLAGHEFFMQQGVPALPAPVAALVPEVLGLDNFALPDFRPPFGLTLHSTAFAGNCSNYGAKHTLTREKLAAAYQFNQLYQKGFQGQGMTIGVAEFGDTYDPRDIANYDTCAGIAPVSIQNIDVVGHLSTGPGEGEAALDLELISGLAPKAQILDYQAEQGKVSFAQELVDVFNRVAADHRVQVLSVSYGTGEDSFSASEQTAVNRSLRNLAAMGVSVFISSGDCGAFTLRVHNIAEVSFPASAPYAIAVGGTHLQVSDGNVRTSEDTWGGDDGAPLCHNEWGSGGGVSQNLAFKRPSWQVGPGTTTRYDGSSGNILTPAFIPVSAPNGLRQVPDLAAAAYPNIAIYYHGAWLAAGGTSAAAPIVAAGMLLVDQGLKQQGKALFGSVPDIYTMANQPGSFHPFNDITRGDNLFYRATRGWDYTTGWGSPNFNDILQSESIR
jgi:kumamolisin